MKFQPTASQVMAVHPIEKAQAEYIAELVGQAFRDALAADRAAANPSPAPGDYRSAPIPTGPREWQPVTLHFGSPTKSKH